MLASASLWSAIAGIAWGFYLRWPLWPKTWRADRQIQRKKRKRYQATALQGSEHWATNRSAAELAPTEQADRLRVRKEARCARMGGSPRPAAGAEGPLTEPEGEPAKQVHILAGFPALIKPQHAILAQANEMSVRHCMSDARVKPDLVSHDLSRLPLDTTQVGVVRNTSRYNRTVFSVQDGCVPHCIALSRRRTFQTTSLAPWAKFRRGIAWAVGTGNQHFVSRHNRDTGVHALQNGRCARDTGNRVFRFQDGRPPGRLGQKQNTRAGRRNRLVSTTHSWPTRH